MNKIIQADFNGQAMHFTTDAWFNATEAAEKYGKRPVDWLNQDGTREYIATLADMLKCEPGSLLKTKRGNICRHPVLARHARQLTRSANRAPGLIIARCAVFVRPVTCPAAHGLIFPH